MEQLNKNRENTSTQDAENNSQESLNSQERERKNLIENVKEKFKAHKQEVRTAITCVALVVGSIAFISLANKNLKKMMQPTEAVAIEAVLGEGIAEEAPIAEPAAESLIEEEFGTTDNMEHNGIVEEDFSTAENLRSNDLVAENKVEENLSGAEQNQNNTTEISPDQIREYLSNDDKLIERQKKENENIRQAEQVQQEAEKAKKESEDDFIDASIAHMHDDELLVKRIQEENERREEEQRQQEIKELEGQTTNESVLKTDGKADRIDEPIKGPEYTEEKESEDDFIDASIAHMDDDRLLAKRIQEENERREEEQRQQEIKELEGQTANESVIKPFDERDFIEPIPILEESEEAAEASRIASELELEKSDDVFVTLENCLKVTNKIIGPQSGKLFRSSAVEFQKVLNEVGVDSLCVVVKDKEGGPGHYANLVELDGSYYYFDTIMAAELRRGEIQSDESIVDPKEYAAQLASALGKEEYEAIYTPVSATDIYGNPVDIPDNIAERRIPIVISNALVEEIEEEAK